jgi:hypothetical protein
MLSRSKHTTERGRKFVLQFELSIFKVAHRTRSRALNRPWWCEVLRATPRWLRRRITPSGFRAGAGWRRTRARVAAVLVQLEWQDGNPGSKEKQSSYGGPASSATGHIRATSVDAPFRARENVRSAVTRSRMLPSVRPLARSRTAGLHGGSRIRSKSTRRTRGTLLHNGFPDPVSPTVAPSPPFARPTPRWPRRT